MPSGDLGRKVPAFRVLLIRLAAMWLIVPLLLAWLDSRLDGFFIVPVALALAVVWVLLALLSLAWSVRFARRHAWRYSLLCLTLPAAMLLGPLRLLDGAMYAGDVAHFFAVKASYDQQIACLPNDGARFEEFNWGGMLFASNCVVYDETDQITLPRARRTASWLARVQGTDLMCGGTDLVAIARPLSGHYYLAGFGC